MGPGSGQLEFGQTFEESVLREVLEEYGVAGEIQGRIPPHPIFREWEGQRTHWIAVPFFIKVDPVLVKNNEPDKIDELGWFRLDDLPEPLHTGFHWTFTHFGEYFATYR